MYQSKVRPELGRELATQQPKQHRGIQFNRNRIHSTISFLFSFHSKNARTFQRALALLTGCVIAFLSGCGGVTFASGTLTKGAGSTSTGALLSTISCGTQSLTGPQSKACSVYLSAPAAAATTVYLKTNNTALTVPKTVVIATGAKTAGFNAVSSSVSKAVSVTITGTAATVTKTDVITLYPAPATAITLSKVSCVDQTLTGPTTTTCSVTLSAKATSQTAVTLSSNNGALKVPGSVTLALGATSGSFTASAAKVTATQTATLTATAYGVSRTDAIQLEGAGTQPTSQHEVELNWQAPTKSPVPVEGYRVYRAEGGSGYKLLNSSIDGTTTYTDIAVESGLTYDYVVKSVDTAGVESAPSNVTSVTVP